MQETDFVQGTDINLSPRKEVCMEDHIKSEGVEQPSLESAQEPEITASDDGSKKIFGMDVNVIKEKVLKKTQDVRDGIREGLGKLKNRDCSEIVQDVKTYIYQHPGRFLFGSFLVGYVFGRIRRKG